MPTKARVRAGLGLRRPHLAGPVDLPLAPFFLFLFFYNTPSNTKKNKKKRKEKSQRRDARRPALAAHVSHLSAGRTARPPLSIQGPHLTNLIRPIFDFPLKLQFLSLSLSATSAPASSTLAIRTLSSMPAFGSSLFISSSHFAQNQHQLWP